MKKDKGSKVILIYSFIKVLKKNQILIFFFQIIFILLTMMGKAGLKNENSFILTISIAFGPYIMFKSAHVSNEEFR